MSKGGGSSTTVQKADPWVGVQPYLFTLYNRVNEAGKNTLPFFPDQTYAGFDPLQQQGMQGMLDYSKDVVQPGVRGYQGSLSQYMNAPLNISQDPAVQAMMASNQQNATDWLTRSALPSIGSGAVAAGQYGGSRQGIAQGLAIGEAAKALSQANAQTMLGAYGDATKLAGVGAGLMPGAFQMGMSPYETMMSVGGMQQGMAQRGIDEAMSRYYYPETSLWDTLGKQTSIYSGAQPYGTSTSTGPGRSAVPDIVGMGSLGLGAYNAGLFGSLGGAAAAAAPVAAASMFGPLAFGTAAAPAAATMAGASAAPLLALMSDPRLKKDVRPIGEINGYNWYTFEYIDEKYGKGRQVGVMADEVLQKNPEAVKEMPNGYLAVNYGAL